MKKPGTVLLLNSESIGRGDDDLGYEILSTMLKTLAGRDDRPIAIIFWNTAVRLLASDSPAVPHLRTLKSKGVKLLGGQLCVNELELAGKLAAGKSATMDEILDLLLHHDVVNL